MEEEDTKRPDAHQFYIMYLLDKATKVNGKELKAGYYRIRYDLSGMDYPHNAQYSEDRVNWEDCEGLFKNFQEFNDLFSEIGEKLMRFERCEYVETVMYRGQCVPVFVDDYGQCFFCIFNNEEVSFGSFQSEYEDNVRHLIDYELEKVAKKVNTP